MTYKILERNGVEIENVDGAAFNNVLAGGKNYILIGVLNECKILRPDVFTIGIDTGMIVVQGIRIKLLEPQYFTQPIDTIPNVDIKYQIVIQLDLQKNRGLAVSSFLRPASEEVVQDNLFKEESGTYQVIFAEFTVTQYREVVNEKIKLPVAYAISESISDYKEFSENSASWQPLNIPTGEPDIFNTYWALEFPRSETTFEMYNVQGERIFCGVLEKDNSIMLYVKEKMNCKVRSIKSPSVSTLINSNKFLHNITLSFELPESPSYRDYMYYRKVETTATTSYNHASIIGGKVLFNIRFQLINYRPTIYSDFREFIDPGNGQFFALPINISGEALCLYDHYTRYEIKNVVNLPVENGKGERKDYSAVAQRLINGIGLVGGDLYIDTCMINPQLNIVTEGTEEDKDLIFYSTPLIYKEQYQFMANLYEHKVFVYDFIVPL